MIVGIALIIISFFSVTNLPSWLDFKPFNCNVCLSFWLSLFISLVWHYFPQFDPILTALCWGGIGAYISIIAKRILFKI